MQRCLLSQLCSNFLWREPVTMLNKCLNLLRRLLATPTIHRVIGKHLACFLERLVWLYHFSKWLKDHNACVEHADRRSLWQMLFDRFELQSNPFTYLEFGVYQGYSIRWWAERSQNAETRFIGFDTFTGLPEDWDSIRPKGTFDTGGNIPKINDERVSFEVGLFQDTLEPFIAKNPSLCAPADQREPPSRILMVHLDSDLYTSTLYCLVTLRHCLRPGDVLIFDDFSVHYIDTEFRAFIDFADTFSIKYELLGCTERYIQVALQICK